MLKSKKGVEIFAAGKWNGDVYTVEDLDEMVRAFEDTHSEWRPPLKLGHSDEQTILQNDGYPAAGYVGKLYRKGAKLFADFVDIPAKVFELLEKGAYKKVSSEIYWGIDVGSESGEPRTYDRMLAGVALLGADMPAVFGLSDIMNWYVSRGVEKKFYTDQKKQPSIKAYITSETGSPSEEEIPAMDKDLEKLKKDKETQDKELAELRKFKADHEESSKKTAAKLEELEEKARNAELDAAVSEIGDLSPAMKPYAKALLGSEKKEYSVKLPGEKGETKKYASRAELLGELLKLHAEALKLNTNEQSQDGEDEEEDDGDEAALDGKIREYMKANKCNYGTAYRAVKAELDRADEGDDEDEEDDEE